MANLYLGSVGTAQAFEMIEVIDNGQKVKKPIIAFTSKTLTDSAVNISTTSDVIRAGTGAAGAFTFSHDATVDITLTDVLFKDAYLEAQLGATFGAPGAPAYQSETKIAADGKIKLDKVPTTIGFNCIEAAVIVWIKKPSDDDFKTLDEIEGVTLAGDEISGLENGQEYCIRYVAMDNAAVETIVTTNIIPKEYFLVITCPLFAGDACSASNGKLAGSITFEIPRFKLNGAQDFTMNMSSNTTLSLSGTALAMDSGCELNGSKLLRIIKVVDGNDLTTGLTDLVAEEETGVAGEAVPPIYGIYGTKVKKLDLADLTITPADAVEGDNFADSASGVVTFALGGQEAEITITGSGS